MAEQIAHPLLQKQLTNTAKWTEWKKLWDEETNIQKLSGLLHCGFEVWCTSSERIERLCFYLDLAHGYNDSSNKVFGEIMAGPRVRGLAIKAWRMLCDKVFNENPEGAGFGRNIYDPNLEDERVIKHLLALFGHDCNLPGATLWKDKHTASTASAFLYGFIDNLWESRYPSEDPRTIFFRSIRPDLVLILLKMQWEDYLLKLGVDIDDATLETLKAIAGMDGKTPEEALVRGDGFCSGRAAKVLILLNAKRAAQEATNACK